MANIKTVFSNNEKVKECLLNMHEKHYVHKARFAKTLAKLSLVCPLPHAVSNTKHPRKSSKKIWQMPLSETYYLIDFENVNEDGLAGSEKLRNHDHVHLFSTRNAPKISIDKLASFNSTNLSSHIIPVGNQSLDMHLSSYLGYLIGTNANANCKYVIISKDSDYDNVVSFWKEQYNSNITRRAKISACTAKTNSNAPVSQNANIIKQTRKPNTASEYKTQLNAKIQQAVSKAGYSHETSNKVASIVAKHYGQNTFICDVHNELRKNFTDYLDLYKIVKPIMTQHTPTTAQHTNTTTKLNSEIQQTLSKAGFSVDITNQVASIISKHHNDNNAKQTIYRTIVSKYGQKNGLDIYNHVKKKI